VSETNRIARGVIARSEWWDRRPACLIGMTGNSAIRAVRSHRQSQFLKAEIASPAFQRGRNDRE
jgi:hypothetical protein